MNKKIDIKKRKLGVFRIQGDSVNLHFPADNDNYFQKKEDNKTIEEDPHLLSDRAPEFFKNFTQMNLSTEYFPVSTENLLNDEGNKILKIKYELEKEKFEDESEGFWQMKKEKKYNKMLSDLQNVINRKNSYPESEISGMIFGKYDPIKTI